MLSGGRYGQILFTGSRFFRNTHWPLSECPPTSPRKFLHPPEPVAGGRIHILVPPKKEMNRVFRLFAPWTVPLSLNLEAREVDFSPSFRPIIFKPAQKPAGSFQEA